MRLRLATFNLESLDECGDPPLAVRIAALRPQLLRLDADLLCLQEVNGQAARGGPRRLAALERLLEETPYAGFERIATDRGGRGPADRHNLVVLSRWPFLSRAELFHDLVPPPRFHRPGTAPNAGLEVRWDRPILAGEVGLPDERRLHVVNLHLRAPLAAPIPGQKLDADAWRSVGGWAEGFVVAAMKRLGQALETRLFVEQLFDREERPLIAVCGDFNADAHEMPLRTVIADVEETGNPALRGRSLVPLERGLPLSRRYSVLYHGRGVMLDHILVSRGLLAAYHHMEVHNEALAERSVSGGAAGEPVESDHAPLAAEFELAPGAG